MGPRNQRRGRARARWPARRPLGQRFSFPSSPLSPPVEVSSSFVGALASVRSANRLVPNRPHALGESGEMGNTASPMPRAFAHLSDERDDGFGRIAYGLSLRVLRDETLAE